MCPDEVPGLDVVSADTTVVGQKSQVLFETRGIREPMSEESASESFLESIGGLEDWYQYPVLGLVIGFMLWVRLRSYDRFFFRGDVYFTGNDAWYHYRMVQYTVENWPRTMPFDPWTYFPYGTTVGQFGTLFDQLIATAALIVGLGDPSPHLVKEVTLVAPAVFGTLAVLPTYWIGKRLGGRFAGVFAALVLAVLPGQFLLRGLVGFSDHNIAEPLFQATAVVASMVAISVAERDRPVAEQVLDRDWDGLQSTLLWSTIAGVATALYVWVWPPGLLLIGILGVFYAIKLTADYMTGVSPDHVGLAAAVSMGVTFVLTLLPISEMSFSPVQYSLIQPLAALGIAVGAVFMLWLARFFDARNADQSLYPTTVVGILLLGTVLVWALLPNLFTVVQRNLVRFIGFGAGAETRTIQEAAPFLSGREFFPAVFGYYGFTFFTALLGGIVTLYQVVRGDGRGERLLVLVWAAFITAAAFTQIRFNYYLAVPVAVLNAALLSWMLGLDFFGAVRKLEDVEAAHVMVVFMVVLLVFAPLVVGVSGGSLALTPAHQIGNSTAPGRTTFGWDGTLAWMQNQTPREGNWDEAGNADRLEYYGTYEQVEDFNYPAGAYGVMSWWDYGHWITVRGHRIPNANPFQEGATDAANFLLAQSEDRGLTVLETVSEDDATTRYVMVDSLMAMPGEKFAAPTVFQTLNESVTASDYRTPLYRFNTNQGQYQFAGWLKTQRYYESMMVRLYRYHGSAMDPQPVVVQWAQQRYSPALDSMITLGPQGGNITLTFDNMSAARDYVENNPNAQIGGLRNAPSEYIPALEHFRMVKASAASMNLRTAFSEGMFGRVPAAVKVFERVPGANVTVTGPAGATVTASVTMNVTTRNSTFVYRQRVDLGSDGEAVMTLPYSTTGYENWGPENGHTNVSVRATGPYTFTTEPFTGGAQNLTTYVYNGSAHVPEGAVIGERAPDITVDLTRAIVDEPTGKNNTSSVDRPAPVLGFDGGAAEEVPRALDGEGMAWDGAWLLDPVTWVATTVESVVSDVGA